MPSIVGQPQLNSLVVLIYTWRLYSSSWLLIFTLRLYSCLNSLSLLVVCARCLSSSSVLVFFTRPLYSSPLLVALLTSSSYLLIIFARSFSLNLVIYMDVCSSSWLDVFTCLLYSYFLLIVCPSCLSSLSLLVVLLSSKGDGLYSLSMLEVFLSTSTSVCSKSLLVVSHSFSPSLLAVLIFFHSLLFVKPSQWLFSKVFLAYLHLEASTLPIYLISCALWIAFNGPALFFIWTIVYFIFLIKFRAQWLHKCNDSIAFSCTNYLQQIRNQLEIEMDKPVCRHSYPSSSPSVRILGLLDAGCPGTKTLGAAVGAFRLFWSDSLPPLPLPFHSIKQSIK